MIANQVAGLFGSPYTAPVGDFQSIQTYTIGSGGASAIEFTSIDSSFKHLQIRLMAKSTLTGGNVSNILVQLGNGSVDTGSNYSWHYLLGEGTAAQAGGNANQSSILAGHMTSADINANTFGVAVIDILDYKDTNKYKTTRTLSGWDSNGSGYIFFNSGNWRSTSAITNVKIYPHSGNLVQYSTAALYGVK